MSGLRRAMRVFGEGAVNMTAQAASYSLMFHGFTYADEAENPDDMGQMTVRFWNPVMNDGYIDFLPPKDCTIKRHIKPMEIKPFGSDLGNLWTQRGGLNLLAGGDDFELDR